MIRRGPPMNLFGKTVLVTGGAKRVGRAIVDQFARAGCHVAVHYRSSQVDAQKTVEMVAALNRRAVLVHGDLNDPVAWPAIITKTVSELGGLDILVNNASYFEPSSAIASESESQFDRSSSARPEPRASARATPSASESQAFSMPDFDASEWDQMFRVNTIAPAALAHHARPHLEAHGNGRIINLCDISAERPWPSYLSYCASKAALVAVTKGLARAFAPTITVSGVSPGIAVFPDEYPRALRDAFVARVPLAREGSPQDIARLVRFLAESGDYITGQIFSVDGGRSIV